jgi:hypothetical protein
MPEDERYDLSGSCGQEKPKSTVTSKKPGKLKTWMKSPWYSTLIITVLVLAALVAYLGYVTWTKTS